LGLLGGALIATNKKSDGGGQLGGVATFYRGRHEVDFDGIWGQGFGRSPSRSQYDISYQFRLTPKVYPEIGLSPELYSVMEYNGRWLEGHPMVHQITLGLQWVHATWVLEGGIIQDINDPHDTRIIISTRIHI